MKQKLFITVSNRAQPSVHATRKENYETLVSQMDVLNPEKIEHKNSRFGEDEVKSLCNTPRPNQGFSNVFVLRPHFKPTANFGTFSKLMGHLDEIS